MELEIKNLNKFYGEYQALDNINIKITQGVYGLLGANGAGKSTLMNLITDNVKKTSGEILFNGVDILKLGKSFRKELGYMPQQQGFYDKFSARAFVLYMAGLKGLSRKQAKEETDHLLKVVNLDKVAHKKIGEFSGGMKQRVLLAQALLGNPKVLLLDEPTAGLDPKERIRIRNFISEIAEDKIVLISTHVVSDIEFIAKEVILLKQGKLVSHNTCNNLTKEIENKVFEVEIEKENLKYFQSNYRVSNLFYMGDKIIVRIVTDNPPKDYVKTPVSPTLEDLYLYVFENGK
ncbi:MAG: ABC transporter ATP-binding protein [Ruminococcus sp.]|nr:ABC transporter ATP-binding protein [Ruminococcus sp.]